MTFREVYVGALGRNLRLDWGGDPDVGNVPPRLSPVFPIAGARVHPHTLVINWVDCGRLKGRQVDWGAHAASVSISDLHEIQTTCYGAGRIPADLATFLLTLTPFRRYAIVAAALEPSSTCVGRPSVSNPTDLHAIRGGMAARRAGENGPPSCDIGDEERQLQAKCDRLQERLRRTEGVVARLIVEIRADFAQANALRKALVERDTCQHEYDALRVAVAEARRSKP